VGEHEREKINLTMYFPRRKIARSTSAFIVKPGVTLGKGKDREAGIIAATDMTDREGLICPIRSSFSVALVVHGRG
jgi:hypothetical protein